MTGQPDDTPELRLAPMTLGLRVTDVRAARSFYGTIGFEEVFLVPDGEGAPLFCVMRIGASAIAFDAVETAMPMPDTARERAMKQGPRGLGVKIGVAVSDIEPIYQVFKMAGCEITCEPMEEFWCERLFTAIDPFGYEWQFTQGSKSAAANDAHRAWGISE